MSEQKDKCNKKNIVSQLIKVQAEVTVTPLVTHGPPKIYRIDSDIKPDIDFEKLVNLKKSKGKYHFTLTQVFCIEIPIELDADVEINSGIVECGKPGFGPCKPPGGPPCKPPGKKLEDKGPIPSDDLIIEF